MALQNLIAFLVTFADNLMVNTLGDVAVSGVYMGMQVHVLLQMLTSGISGALVIIAAQYWGKGDRESIKILVATALKIATAAGLILNVFCCAFSEFIVGIFTPDAGIIAQGAVYLRIVSFSYVFFSVSQTMIAALRSVEVTKAGLLVSAMSLVINIILNYVLIFGKFGFPAMGVAGAAIATVASRVCEVAVLAVYLSRDEKLNFRVGDIAKRSSSLFRDFIKYGTPLVLGEVVWSVNLMASGKIMGLFDASVITAASVANTMNTMLFVVIGGMASALGIITGKTVGAGKTELMREYAVTTQWIFLGLGIVLGTFTFLIRGAFVGLYTGISPEAARQSMNFITVMAVSITGTCYQMPCLFGLVKSGGDINFVFKNDTIFVFCVVLPSAIIAYFLGQPAWAVFACLKCDQVLKCAVAVVKVNKFDWIKNLTAKPA